MQDVVVTQVGLVTSGGVGRDAAWQALVEGRSGLKEISLFPTTQFATHKAFEVAPWQPATYWRSRRVAYFTRSTQFAYKAAEECLEAVAPEARAALGIVLGSQYSTIHNYHKLLEEPDFMTPVKFLGTLPSSIPTNVSIACGLRGLSTALSSSVAGLHSLAYAADLVRGGYCSAVLAGGAEELSCDVYGGCHLAQVLAGQSGGEEECRPLDPARNGLVPGEGSAVLLVEAAASAAEGGRGALARVAGSGTAYSPGRREDVAVEAGCHAIAAALCEAGLRASDVGAVFSGANGTPDGDDVAARILERTFGGDVPIVALKAWTGEMFGAFGALAIASGALALRDGVLPGGRRPADLRAVLVHDFSCEGNHAALVLTRAPGGAAESRPGTVS
jgi:3-oxoacyl-(acyl-carrier-protein) synthase